MLMGANETVTAARMEATEAKAWALAQRVGKFGYAEIATELSISADAAKRIILGWCDEGRVRVEHGGGAKGRKMFVLTPEYRQPTDRTSLIAGQFWTAMRTLKKFGPVDLLAHCREDLRPELKEARAYCRALLQGGYLSVLRTADPSVGREATYVLVHNSGPRAPQEKRVTAVWDANEGAYAFVSGIGRVERAK